MIQTNKKKFKKRKVNCYSKDPNNLYIKKKRKNSRNKIKL